VSTMLGNGLYKVRNSEMGQVGWGGEGEDASAVLFCYGDPGVRNVENHRRSYRTEVSFVCAHSYCVSNLY